MERQKHLSYITNLIINDLKSHKIRAVDAVWIDVENTASLSFYLDGEATGEELEDISIACAEIIAHCANGLLEENYFRLDYPKLLPESHFRAFKREEKN